MAGTSGIAQASRGLASMLKSRVLSAQLDGCIAVQAKSTHNQKLAADQRGAERSSESTCTIKVRLFVFVSELCPLERALDAHAPKQKNMLCVQMSPKTNRAVLPVKVRIPRNRLSWRENPILSDRRMWSIIEMRTRVYRIDQENDSQDNRI
jgi:hypothetical protein